jgi:hypothetical protein
LRQQFTRAQEEAAEKATAEVAKVKKDALVAVAEVRKQAQLDRNAIEKQAKEAALLTLPTKVAEAVNAEKLRHIAEKLKLTEQLEDMKRKLEKRTPQDLGDEGEIQVFEMLQQTFTDDELTRVAKGVAGADIEHRIVHNGVVVGSLVYDHKNTKIFQGKWLPKLRQDQIAARADHAVLVTTAFKSGYQHLIFAEGLLVVSPARVVEVAKWLRAQVIRNHSLRLSAEAKDAKAQKLYAFMCSDRVSDRWDRMAQTVARMRNALRTERLSHEKAWSDRGTQLDLIQQIRDSFVEDLDAIFEGTEPEGVS